VPQARRFFTSEKFGGYAESDAWRDRLQNPSVYPFVLVFWGLCAFMLIVGYQSVVFGFLNLVLCRYFFIQMRWQSLLRGMGAPGFMAYWLAAVVFFLEYSSWGNSTVALRSTVVLLFRLDFAFIILSAGLYKMVCGYPRNEGMEYGLVNPWWGYWWRWYQCLPPGHWIFKSLNHLAYVTEIVAAIFLFIPQTQWIGMILIILSFAFIATQIRLGFLCEMVMVAALIFVGSGSLGDQLLRPFVSTSIGYESISTPKIPILNSFLNGLLWGYIILLPLAHGGLYYNLLVGRSLPFYLQKLLEQYTNFFGIMIWRVFSVDIINFFVRIYVMNPQRGEKTLYSRLGEFDWKNKFRYLHVGESIAMATIFTTLKYYPSRESEFKRRLRRYARTVPTDGKSAIIFEYIRIVKSPEDFQYIPVAEYTVDLEQDEIKERHLDPRYSIRTQEMVSPVHEGAFPGSYAPLECR